MDRASDLGYTHGMSRARQQASRRPVEADLSFDRVPGLDEIPEIARRARRAWGAEPSSRLDLTGICARLGIDIRVVSLQVPDGGAQGFLVPRPTGGFRIEIDPEPRGGWRTVLPSLRRQLERHRRRFLIAHELTHTLFYEGTPEGPRRLVLASSAQETFCDELARALLVPHEAAAALPFEPESVVELHRRFDVSIEVALRALVASHDQSATGWLLVYRSDETLVQWTSADRDHTATMLDALRQRVVPEDPRPQASARTNGAVGKALHLPRRNQLIVTQAPRESRRAA